MMLKTPEEIDAIARSGAILAELYRALPAEVAPGKTTAELDRFAESFIRDHDGAEPAFKGLYGFPASLCISVNHEVVHGIPSSRRRLVEGDVVSLDGGVKYRGWYSDAAITVPVGEVSPEVQELLDVTRDAMFKGIKSSQAGNRLGDIGAAIQEVAVGAGYGIVRDLVGHGIGRSPHEEPQVPNYGRAGKGMPLEVGLVICVEPMFNLGTANVRTLPDRWTVVTADRRVSAHFEHTIAVTESGPRILTA
ncbi:MAG TPA: type I methionyl aminopeptidase [Longimicrobiaceae bacterium]|nr:type I methionyl aminopeptidase [Longimicrobiaceae bacterium]